MKRTENYVKEVRLRRGGLLAGCPGRFSCRSASQVPGRQTAIRRGEPPLSRRELKVRRSDSPKLTLTETPCRPAAPIWLHDRAVAACDPWRNGAGGRFPTGNASHVREIFEATAHCAPRSLGRMTAAEICWLFLALIGLAYALASTWGVALVVRRVPVLLRDHSPPPARWPRVSLLVPARNEIGTLGPAMRSRLAEGYPALEVVLVDDRSTDGTSALVDTLAAEDDRIRALHVDSLPPGWLGKLHAMSEGLQLATGEWILFSDADVHLVAGTIARAVAFAEAHRLDHLSILPELLPATWLVDAALASFTRTGLVMGRVWLVSDPRSNVGGSVGA